MTIPINFILKTQAMTAIRDYGVQLTMFRNAMAEWAGLNVTDMECLRFLFQKRISTPSELARLTGLTSGATTAMLDRLEKAELIERQPNPDDRRGTLITPTQSSAGRVASWFEASRKAQEELISSFSEKELEVLVDVFGRFANLWEKERIEIQKEP